MIGKAAVQKNQLSYLKKQLWPYGLLWAPANPPLEVKTEPMESHPLSRQWNCLMKLDEAGLNIIVVYCNTNVDKLLLQRWLGCIISL